MSFDLALFFLSLVEEPFIFDVMYSQSTQQQSLMNLRYLLLNIRILDKGRSQKPGDSGEIARDKTEAPLGPSLFSFLSSKCVRLWLSLMIGLGLAAPMNGQTPNLYIDFDTPTRKINERDIDKAEAVYMVDLLQPKYAKGLQGRALDLSADASLRMPMRVDSTMALDYDENASFSTQVWIKTKPNAAMGTPVMGNKKAEALAEQGWQIYTRENGAWALNFSDGKTRFDYRPTAQRQRINDGEWHQLLFTLDREKEEVWMYLDGKNVAIYNIAGLAGLNNAFATVIGGSDEKWEYGSAGQWNAFNGYLDEVKMWDQAITPKQAAEFYRSFKTIHRGQDSFDNGQLRVLAWNIWHGGHRYGQQVGLQRVIETIQASKADVIGLIETYGSGEIIADSLGYYFYLISSNLSIMSRFPILETVQAFRPFNFGGAKLDMGGDQELLFLDTWLHYLPDYLKEVRAGKMSAEELVAGEGETRHSEIRQILTEMAPLLAEEKTRPVIMSGDFNSGSHLDWIPATKAVHAGYAIEWPVSKAMTQAGFKDSYRELHINPLLDLGLTWTPRAATSSDKYGLRDRIDYIYYLGDQLQPIESKVLDYHPIMFPSDHAGVLTVFKWH